MPVDLLLRADNGSALTHTEMDNNMTLLQDAVNASRLESISITTDTSITVNYRMIIADASGNTIVGTLPLAADAANMLFVFIKTDSTANTVTVQAQGIETINGASSQAISSQWGVLRIFCDGIAFYIV